MPPRGSSVASAARTDCRTSPRSRRGAPGSTSRRPPRCSRPVPSTPSTAAWQLADHGLFYPFQWSAPDQRARDMADFYAPPSVWEQLAPTGSRTLAVDPYESRPPTVTPSGALVCGWQLHRSRGAAPLGRADRRPPPAAAGLRSPATGGRGVRSPLGQGDAPSAPAPARRAGTGRRRGDAPARRRALRPRMADVLRGPRGRSPVLGSVPARPCRARQRHRTPPRRHAGGRLPRSRRRPRASGGRPPRGHGPPHRLPGRHGREHQPGRPAPRDAPRHPRS